MYSGKDGEMFFKQLEQAIKATPEMPCSEIGMRK